MQLIRESGDLQAFMRKLSRTSSRVLLLDYDGTLAPFKVERDKAIPYPGVARVLREIMARGTRVVIVSGRAADELPRLLGVSPAPEIWGSHGWERLTGDGAKYVAAITEPHANALAAAEAHAQRFAREEVERKPRSIALHWRGLEPTSRERLVAGIVPTWAELAERSGLQLHDFDGGVELRVPGRDKGQAVSAILAETPADAAVAYLGDDLTDEDAFRALGDRGLGVLVRAELRDSAAALWITPPGELLDFLEQWQLAVARALT